jgi:hypothetical protein
MSIHHEINFEKEICQYLGSNGWLYTEGDAAGYDRARAVFPADAVDWVRAVVRRDPFRRRKDFVQEIRTALIFATVTGQIDIRREVA